MNDRTILYSLQSYWIRQSQSDKTVFSLGRSPERRGDDPGSLSHRRFHLNRNLLDKNIRPSSARRDWEVKGGKRGSLSLSLSPSSRRINRTACKFWGKSQFIHLRQWRRKRAPSSLRFRQAGYRAVDHFAKRGGRARQL